MIEAAGEIAPHLKAFYGVMYYSALRPEEALHLTPANYSRPSDETGWGWLNLTGSTVGMSTAWNDGEDYYEDRALKHRARQTSRRVPVPPELVVLLDEHITRYKVPENGRLFVTRVGSTPGRPVSTSTYTRIWRRTREKVLTAAQVDSTLARVPYQLRHACVSLWLNAGVPPTQVAEWAGHSLHVLLKVYAKCIDGEEEQARRWVAEALAVSSKQAPAPTDMCK